MPARAHLRGTHYRDDLTGDSHSGGGSGALASGDVQAAGGVATALPIVLHTDSPMMSCEFFARKNDLTAIVDLKLVESPIRKSRNPEGQRAVDQCHVRIRDMRLTLTEFTFPDDASVTVADYYVDTRMDVVARVGSALIALVMAGVPFHMYERHVERAGDRTLRLGDGHA